MKKNGFAQNSIWIISGQIVRLLISFIISVLTTRYLGPSNFGLISYIQSFITFFTAIISLGLNGVIIYELVNHRNDGGKILGTSIVLRLIVGVVCAVVFLLAVFNSRTTDTVLRQIAFLQCIQLPFLCLDTIQYWFQSQLKSKYPVIAQTMAHLITSLYKVFLLVTGKSVEWFSFALSLDVIILGLFYFLLYQKQKTNSLQISLAVAKRIGCSCIPFTLASVMTVIYGQMDKVMIQLILKDEAQVGLYTVAITVCTLISFIPSAILESARPLVMKAKKQDDTIYKKRFKQMVAGVFWVCFLYSIFICILSNFVLNILYGAAYLGADKCLKIAVWYTAFSFIGSAKSIWLICENKNRYVFFFSALGAGTNLVLNYFMIPIIGINGAALATLITEVLVNFIYPAFIKDTRGYTKSVSEAIFLKGIDAHLILSTLKNKITSILAH